MGINEQQLLRMLEPALRPGVNGLHAQGSRSSNAPPIESRSFESILDEAQQLAQKLPDWPSIEKALAAASHDNEQKQRQESKAASGLLAELQRIENASLTRLLSGTVQSAMSQQGDFIKESSGTEHGS